MEAFDQEYENYQESLNKQSECENCREVCETRFCCSSCESEYTEDWIN